ncbi:hypothetical protein CXG81DRAFT_18622 [Caulochytrium protostelioides]|uniref:Uncharacterized protein n=1 Tax=Caulochytrium protostelioides TaxID=1555241 RepID=A0A4P9X8L8_9FUNG|nr:hypothetical protein CXG81DRAFT_18622 [Caulochytrium protostelioides]|eukprot:RKP01626.1 hypothetical protein CXG81DRAFT_18622 [Caulochytrium protostelioides]
MAGPTATTLSLSTTASAPAAAKPATRRLGGYPGFRQADDDGFAEVSLLMTTPAATGALLPSPPLSADARADTPPAFPGPPPAATAAGPEVTRFTITTATSALDTPPPPPPFEAEADAAALGEADDRRPATTSCRRLAGARPSWAVPEPAAAPLPRRNPPAARPSTRQLSMQTRRTFWAVLNGMSAGPSADARAAWLSASTAAPSADAAAADAAADEALARATAWAKGGMAAAAAAAPASASAGGGSTGFTRYRRWLRRETEDGTSGAAGGAAWPWTPSGAAMVTAATPSGLPVPAPPIEIELRTL